VSAIKQVFYIWGNLENLPVVGL